MVIRYIESDFSHSLVLIFFSQDGSLHVSWFRLKDDISAEMSAADLVVSHAGAGSCTEALRAGRRLVIVVNERLMNDHQSELADRLHQLGHGLTCRPRTLAQTLISASNFEAVAWPPAETSRFSTFLESFVGFTQR